MKYIKSRKQYEAGNVTFNVETFEAWSYGWWRFVERINGVVVFNNFPYSRTTIQHQRKIRSLLHTLGVEINVVVHAPGGLQDIDSAIRYYHCAINALQAEITRKGTHKAANEKRQMRIESLQHCLANAAFVKDLKTKGAA